MSIIAPDFPGVAEAHVAVRRNFSDDLTQIKAGTGDPD